MRTTILVLLTLLGACAAKTPKPNDAPGALNLDVVLLDPGAEPRSEVRYHGASGKTDRVLLRLSLANFLETSAGTAAVATPVLDLVLHLGATYRGDTEGVWGYPIRMEMIGINGADQLSDEQRAKLVAELAPVSQVKGVFELDERGITRNAEVSMPPGVSPRLLTLLGNVRTTLLAAALPKEAVGIGARWEAQRIIKLGQMNVPQTVTYTLLDRDQDVLRLGVAVRQSAKPQSFSIGLDGTTFDLESYEMSAVGSVIVDLHGLAPLAEMHALSQMRATMRRAGEAAPVAMSGDGTILIAPLPAGIGEAPVPESVPPKDETAQPAPVPGASSAFATWQRWRRVRQLLAWRPRARRGWLSARPPPAFRTLRSPRTAPS